MDRQNWRKVIQKQAYDIISHRYGLLVIVVGAILIVISAFHFGESVVEWSTEKYASVFNSFSDNLVGKSFRDRLCLPVPIDVVYTWVNGTDPVLLANLKRFKHEMQDELNISSEIQCVFSNCLPTNMVVLDPLLPGNMNLSQLSALYPMFIPATSMFKINSPLDNKNYSVIMFPEEQQVLAALNVSLKISGQNTSSIRGYMTSDGTVVNSVRLHDHVIMSGFPHTLTGDELKSKLPEKHQKLIEKIDVLSDRGIAVLHIPVKADLDKILHESNFTIDGKEPTLNAANLIWDLRDFSRDEDISSSRFEDNEELRYSLRSLERFAPWIRHVYIVTNGQLPHWLNLEYSRVTIVTHDEIFANHSHLPSFGSPAIESNLHRIPGISDKFIYMNDDVMFGRDVWPDDFFTFSTGQKVYLTWPVPNCNEGCPSSWLKDGYCDKACNVSECDWDAGDCDGKQGQQHAGWAGAVGWNPDTGYCNQGCANNWIADRYCDTACNTLKCGFDAGDCGTDNYDQMHGFQLLSNVSQYILPKGLTLGYFNVTSLLSAANTSIKSAFYDDTKVIRTIAMARKYDVLTVVLLPNMNKTCINFTVEYGHDNVTHQHNFTLWVETLIPKYIPVIFINKTSAEGQQGHNISMETNKTKAVHEEKEVINFSEIAVELESPRILKASVQPEMGSFVKDMPTNWSVVPLPQNLRNLYDELQTELKEDELTETGYSLRIHSLWLSYQQFLQHNHSQAGEHNLKVKQPDGNGRNIPLHEVKQPQIELNKVAAPDPDSKPAAKADIRKQRRSRRDEAVADKNKAAGRKLMTVDEMEVGDGAEEEHPADDGGRNWFIDNVNIQPEEGKVFPWERGSLRELQDVKDKLRVKEEYGVVGYRGRRTLDTFGDSLRHVNKLYNKAFGYVARKVPGHMPHMIDKNIMAELQARFPDEWSETSSHKVRSSTDMQYAFAYFYYMMGVKENVTAADVFDEMDTDHSRILSDREIRTLAVRLYDLPLDLQTLTKLEYTFVNCSRNMSVELQHQPDAGSKETYYVEDMPQLTRNLFINCPEVVAIVSSNFPPRNKYKHTIVGDEEIAFKMIKTNVSSVVGQLDDVRKHPKKFICLNDNIDHSDDQAKTVKAILQDFYESVFPTVSQFELPRDYRNRFSHIDELRGWRRYRDWLKFWTHLALLLLVIFTVVSYFGDKIEAAQRRYSRRRTVSDQPAAAESDGQGRLEPEGQGRLGTIQTV